MATNSAAWQEGYGTGAARLVSSCNDEMVFVKSETGKIQFEKCPLPWPWRTKRCTPSIFFQNKKLFLHLIKSTAGLLNPAYHDEEEQSA